MADVTRSRRLEAPVEEERHHVPPRGYWADAWSRLLRSRAGQAGLVIVGLMAILAVVGPMIAPWDPGYKISTRCGDERQADPALHPARPSARHG